MNNEKRIEELMNKTCTEQEEKELFALWNIEQITIGEIGEINK